MALQTPLAITADDLTGACDAGVKFQQNRLPAIVWLFPVDEALIQQYPSRVKSFCLDSRRRQLPEVLNRLEQVLRLLEEWRLPLLFHKIDSTLRGHVRAEVEFITHACKPDLIVFCNAVPEQGRIVTGGKAWLIKNGGQRQLLGDLQDLFSGLQNIWIVDAMTPAELRVAVTEAFERASRPLFVGASGLASALAAYLAEQAGCEVSEWESWSPRVNGPVLFVIGSSNPLTRRQLDYLLECRQVLPLAAGAPELETIREDKSYLLEWSFQSASAELRLTLEHFFSRARPAVLVLSGGDTAQSVLEIAQARGIQLLGEVEPGIPYGIVISGWIDGQLVVTKAGGFGQLDSLVRVHDFARCYRTADS